MTIGDYIKATDRKQYNRLMNMFKEDEAEIVARTFKVPSSILKEIKLGDSIENLMAHDYHKRVGRRIKQIK